MPVSPVINTAESVLPTIWKLLELYEKIFELNGFEVMPCENGHSALEVIGKEDIAVVVSDGDIPINSLPIEKEANRFFKVLFSALILECRR